jgi:uncharacterized protein YktB (UPF0637 family)
MVQFPGFTGEDFEAFSIPEFHDRMFYIRSRIRPKLAQLGDDVAPKLTALGHPLYPHTASHARRRVNPPDDTWVAFSRSLRGYKRYAHFEIGVDREQVFVRFVVKPEGEEDKPALLRHLEVSGLEAFRQLKDPEPIYWYRDDHGHDPVAAIDLTSERLGEIINHTRKKSHGFTVGMSILRTNPLVSSAQLVAQSVNMITHLSPLYLHTVSEELVDVHG